AFERPPAAFGGSPPREGETRAKRARGSLTHHLELQLSNTRSRERMRGIWRAGLQCFRSFPKTGGGFVFQRLIPILVVIAVLASAAFAQQTTATVTGTVTDPTGALVPGVTITVTNLATNGVRETKSDETGSYTLPFLPAGEYSVTAGAPGFQTQKIDRVTLQVQQTARVDLQLRVGDVAETVNVEAFAVALQTDNATVGTVIDGAKILDPPLNGRNCVQLAQLIPSVHPP